MILNYSLIHYLDFLSSNFFNEFSKKDNGQGISRIIYATILILSVMESLEVYPTNSIIMIIIIILTVVSILLIESYSDILEHDN